MAAGLWQAALGGCFIGLAAALLLWSHGKVAGISGILGGLMTGPAQHDRAWRLAFLAGLILTGFFAAQIAPQAFASEQSQSGWSIALAGVLVGYGTRLGNGCTSGHGVCGISRGSGRSLVATAIFILFGAITVFIVRHGLQGGL